ncbi:hypothetical protein EDF53_0742 [Curtobacterium sp. PhB78]|nr:hypothetical protein EDF53_0742 [Curtobacterium sp. PhB78]
MVGSRVGTRPLLLTKRTTRNDDGREARGDTATGLPSASGTYRTPIAVARHLPSRVSNRIATARA